ncbi:MAG: hypothetical protein R6V57_13935 [Vicinamibacterales bacterium]
MGALLGDTAGVARILLIGAIGVPAGIVLHGSAHGGTKLTPVPAE